MFIEIEDLKQEPLQVRHVYEVGQIRLAHEDAALSEPVSVNFTLTHKDRELKIEGSCTTAILYRCSRCLKEYSRPLALYYNLYYRPQPKALRTDEEIALKYEEMDISFYDGLRLDVDLMVLEQVELAMPMKFTCREDCHGLCYVCGADLNEGNCGCRREEPDSRLASLLEFRKKMKKE